MSVLAAVPLYRSTLDPLEHYSLQHSLARLGRRECVAIGPDGLDLGYYREYFPQLHWQPFAPERFASIQAYNRLLLDPAFYAAFAPHRFLLILQTDAIVLEDALDAWCARPFDYIGAPWPDGLSLRINAGKLGGARGKAVHVSVGNGGLSLRRIDACQRLLREFRGELLEYFLQSGSSEDLFFAFMGALSEDFVIPNEFTASLFSLELQPAYYYAVNGRLPMGCHAWWKHAPDFWRAHLPAAPLPP